MTDNDKIAYIKIVQPTWLPFLGYTDIRLGKETGKAFVFQWLRFGYIFWVKGIKYE